MPGQYVRLEPGGFHGRVERVDPDPRHGHVVHALTERGTRTARASACVIVRAGEGRDRARWVRRLDALTKAATQKKTETPTLAPRGRLVRPGIVDFMRLRGVVEPPYSNPRSDR